MTKIQEPSRVEIWKMFDQISPTYDRVNRVMTLGLDQHWRKAMVKFLPDREEIELLDCATGTADQLICLMERSGKIKRAVGIDLAAEMVEIGKQKVQGKPYADAISFQVASALELPFADASFDCVTISFGIRNVTDVRKALLEFLRVLRPGGKLVILEGTLPESRILKPVFLFYLRHLLPRIGGWISKNRSAYRYLNETMETFPAGEKFCGMLRRAGFRKAKAHPQTGGMVTIYTGEKNA